MFVACQDGSVDPSEIPGTPLEIVDKDGVWVSTELSAACKERVTTFADYVEGAEGEKGDPVAVVKRRFEKQGLRPGDVLELAGYPEDEETIVRVVRAGEIAATVELRADSAGGWLVSEVTACASPLALTLE